MLSDMIPHGIAILQYADDTIKWMNNYDRTTSEMRDLSPKIISGDSRWSENTQTQHI
jgi:hypothetical protein